MNLIEIPLNPSKEVFTVKSDGKYYGAITGEESVFVISEAFDSPLKASNHARSVKRQQKITVNIKKQQTTSVSKNTPKISKKNRLYLESEMASHTHLRFREVWLVINPDGKYASKILADKSVVTYVPGQDKAQVFRTYEEARLALNTLDMVIRKGHELKRFFEETNNE
jgi:hypothetical protein